MALEPIYEVINCDYKKQLSAAQTVVECRMTPEGAEIAKVLAISAEAVVDSFETLGGEADYAGRVDFRVVFADTAGATQAITSSVPFRDKLSDGCITPSLKCIPHASVMDIDTVSVSEKEIKLATVVEVTASAHMRERVEYLKSAGDDIYTQEEQISVSVKTAEFRGEWSISEEIDPKMNILKVLACDSAAVMTSIKTGLDSVTVEGSVISVITAEAEGGVIKSITHTLPFTEEIAASGAVSDNAADAFVNLTNASVTLEKDISGEHNILRLDFKVCSSGATYKEESQKAVVDAFSTRNELKINSEGFPVTRFLFAKACRDRVEGSATLELNMPEVDNILAVCASRMTITGANASEGKLILEGLVNTSVIYYNAAANSTSSIAVELPYSLTLNQDGAKEGQTLIARGIAGAGSARIKRANEIEISVDIYCNVSFYEKTDAFVIKELTLGEERAQSKSAIAIYVTRGGETLWEVAKSLMSTPEVIMQQNPSLKVPMPTGTRIMVYKQLEADFN